MEQKTLYPFRRNRYYPGKLLTSTDFQVEQNYTNNKRQFLNQFIFGTGIVCGLSVINLDDFSIMIESGVAIDGMGREIIVDSTVVKKLSTIEGFSDLNSDRVALCLKYREDETQPVYTVQKETIGQEFENNHVSEGYRLYLADTEFLQPSYEIENEFYTVATLYQGDSYKVDIIMPAVISCGNLVKLLVQIKCIVPTEKDFNLQAVLQMPSFTTQEGLNLLKIKTGNIHIEVGETYKSEYWVSAQKQENNSATIIARAEDVFIIENGQERMGQTGCQLRTAIKSVSPSALITNEIGRASLEMRQMGASKDYIKLAEFNLVRTENSYVIEEVFDGEIKKYIPLPAEDRIREEYSSFYRDAVTNSSNIQTKSDAIEPAQTSHRELLYASGICEIPLNADGKKEMIFYSDEILHGLGRGNVRVDIGLHYLKYDQTILANGRCTIYGEAELFHEEEELPIVHASTAVKMLNDKGSFVVALKLLKDTEVAIAELTWSAVKLPRADGLDYLDERTNRSIVAETATVSLKPTESHFFNIRFVNMEQCSLRYAITEENGGEITRDGVYTAPAKEGIYEIKITCTESPVICTYVYVVVQKRHDSQ